LNCRARYDALCYYALVHFVHRASYLFDSTYSIGNIFYVCLTPTALPNVNLTWEKMAIYNAGLDFSLWNQKLYGELEVFRRDREGIPGSRLQSLPTTFGAALPVENLNSQRTQE